MRLDVDIMHCIYTKVLMLAWKISYVDLRRLTELDTEVHICSVLVSERKI